MTEREISYGSLASISACPQHVRLGGNLGNAGCPVLSVGGIGCHPNKPRGVPRVDDRRVLNSIFWVLALKCSLARPAISVAREGAHQARFTRWWMPMACRSISASRPVRRTIIGCVRFFSAHCLHKRCYSPIADTTQTGSGSLPANKAPGPIFHRSAIAKTQSALAHNCISAVRRIFASSGFGGEYGRLPRIGRPIPHACSLSP